MRVTFLNQFYAPDISPTAQLAASLAEHRAARGDQVTVIASRGGYVQVDGQDADRLESSNPRVRRLWTPRLGKASKLRRVIDYGCFYAAAAVRLATLPRQDVIVSLTTPPFIAWTAVLHTLLHRRCRLVLWNMDCYPEVAERGGVIREGGLLSRAMRRANRALLRRMDHLVCLDTAMADLLTGAYASDGRSPAVTVIPNWEPAATFADPAPAPWPEADAPEFAGRFIVLYMGNMGQGHAFDTAIAAAKRLEGDGVTFLFVGGGSRRREIEEAVARTGANNVVLRDYLPARSQTLQVMAAAGAALITLRDDAVGVMSPSKLHANLAMGLPIAYVGPTRSNVDDAIVRFDCGVSLREGDVDGLVRFIRTLRSDPDVHARLRRRAREAFEQAYCDTVTLPRFDQVLDQADQGQDGAAATSTSAAASASAPKSAPGPKSHERS